MAVIERANSQIIADFIRHKDGCTLMLGKKEVGLGA
jgi:hypothetical protein